VVVFSGRLSHWVLRFRGRIVKNGIFGVAVFALTGWASGQTHMSDPSEIRAMLPLDFKIEHFDVTNAILRDALYELGLKNVEGLHVGMEEIIREDINQDPKTVNLHFSLHLEGKTVREILDQLCRSDSRYTWSVQGNTVNIYPVVTIGDPSYFLNLPIRTIEVTNIPDPNQGLTPLSRLFPQQQIGYSGPGLASNEYTESWTSAFENLTDGSSSIVSRSTWDQGHHGFGREGARNGCSPFGRGSLSLGATTKSYRRPLFFSALYKIFLNSG
jgi:hypothetical protein